MFLLSKDSFPSPAVSLALAGVSFAFPQERIASVGSWSWSW